MFYSVDRSGLYQTGGTLDLWQQDPRLGRPFWRLPDWFEADDLRAHVAELFPDGLSLHGWQYMVERHDFIRPTNSDALFVNHNMVVELVFEYVRRAVFPSRCSRFQSFFAWESLEMARAFRKEGQASSGLHERWSLIQPARGGPGRAGTNHDRATDGRRDRRSAARGNYGRRAAANARHRWVPD